MIGKQVNLRFDETELDRLKEIALRNGVAVTGKVEPHTKLIRDTVQAIFFSSTKEQAAFLDKYAYKRNACDVAPVSCPERWNAVICELEKSGISPEDFMKDWMPIIEPIQKIGLDIHGSPDEIFRRASRLGAIITVANAVGAKSENVRQAATEDLLDRAGYKPIDRTESVNVSLMSEAEVDSRLRSTLDNLGLVMITKETYEKISIAMKDKGLALEAPLSITK